MGGFPCCMVYPTDDLAAMQRNSTVLVATHTLPATGQVYLTPNIATSSEADPPALQLIMPNATHPKIATWRKDER